MLMLLICVGLPLASATAVAASHADESAASGNHDAAGFITAADPHAPHPPQTPEFADPAASSSFEHADCEPGVLPHPVRVNDRCASDAALPDIADAVSGRPRGPDPRPPEA